MSDEKILIVKDVKVKQPTRAEERKIRKLRKRERAQEQDLFRTRQEIEEFDRKYPWYDHLKTR